MGLYFEIACWAKREDNSVFGQVKNELPNRYKSDFSLLSGSGNSLAWFARPFLDLLVKKGGSVEHSSFVLVDKTDVPYLMSKMEAYILEEDEDPDFEKLFQSYTQPLEALDDPRLLGYDIYFLFS